MRTSRARFLLIAIAVAVAAVFTALPLTPAHLAAYQPNVTVDPALYRSIYYRPLLAFSRGGRVTAVTGVPGNTQLYYMGAAGGGVCARPTRARDGSR
jgi:hypothetical protein